MPSRTMVVILAAILIAASAHAQQRNDVPTRHTAAVAMMRAHAWERAAAALEKALEENDDDGFAHYQLGYCRHELREFDAAIAHFDRAIELRYERAAAWYNKGCAYAQSDRIDEAFQALQASMDAGFEHLELLDEDPELAELRSDPRFGELRSPTYKIHPQARPIRFSASDGRRIFAAYYAGDVDDKAPLLLLCHEAGSNAGEYRMIAPWLMRLGYNCLAIDLRHGGTRFERDNLTARAGQGAASEAYADLDGALTFARNLGAQRVAVVGSGYAAALALRLAAERRDEIDAVLAFSIPTGDDMPEGLRPAAWAEEVTHPVLIATPKEATGTAPIRKALIDAGAKVDYLFPSGDVEGSAMLRFDGDRAAWKRNRQKVESFLRTVWPDGSTLRREVDETDKSE